jgi:hypothetical protein
MKRKLLLRTILKNFYKKLAQKFATKEICRIFAPLLRQMAR